ncbi:NAD(P)H-dependent flavin oxidoreductase [Oleisolibacter albus]|uniref:NAD(P)H-dependent flavin oxidoreductase n=1 Tax=Oleisolibacter albus TaxID=2171757 RepID=UPI000DF4B59D|nr:nitronate monooxygenase family protein [Oleisolibacter albus]
MPIPTVFKGRLALPVIASPMFIVSYPELVLAECKAGIIGTFPSLNARPLEVLDEWLGRITSELASYAAANPDKPVAPFGVNLIVHKSNPRLLDDLALVVKHKVPLIITSVGAPTQIVEAVHSYGGLVFHDVTNIKHAKKALEAGVDGLILVCAGAGGHAGTLSPFALLPEVRQFFDGPIVLAGSMSSGAAIRAAEALGADFAYMGTRFIATEEAHASPAYKQMIVDGSAADIVYTPVFSGIPGNYLAQSVVANGIDPTQISATIGQPNVADWNEGSAKKAWKDIWSAGQGIGTIHDVPTVSDLVQRLVREYQAAASKPVFGR